MRRIAVALLLLCVLHPTNAAAQRDVGAVVAMGGGDTTPDIIARTMALAGGREAVIVVLPQASSAPDAGDGAVKEWRDAGAKDVLKVDFADRAAARAAVERATLIWITGGDQNRFMKAIRGHGSRRSHSRAASGWGGRGRHQRGCCRAVRNHDHR